MEKGGITLLLLGILLFSPLVLAQEQSQTYSGFNRFADNVRLFFSSGDNKVMFSLEIREKEVNSAIATFQDNGDLAFKSLEQARKKLLIVQEKVSADIAKEVKSNLEGMIDNLEEYKNISENFETYVLEEEKTKLTTELVIEVEGKEGQTLKREVVRDEATGEKRVKVVVNLEGGEQKIIELQEGIVQLENQIAERIVVKSVATSGSEGTSMEGGLTPEVKTDIKTDIYGNEVKTEVKTAKDVESSNKLPEPDLNQYNPDLYNPDARAPGDTIDEGEVEMGESCGEGVVC